MSSLPFHGSLRSRVCVAAAQEVGPVMGCITLLHGEGASLMVRLVSGQNSTGLQPCRVALHC